VLLRKILSVVRAQSICASSINKEAWAFLQQHKLAAPPGFQQYQLIK
jgi:hypothetical protein